MFSFSSSQEKAKDVVAVISSIAGILGALIGYVTGVSRKEKAEDPAAKEEQKVAAVAEQAAPGQKMLQAATTAFPDLFNCQESAMAKHLDDHRDIDSAASDDGQSLCVCRKCGKTLLGKLEPMPKSLMPTSKTVVNEFSTVRNERSFAEFGVAIKKLF